ncbi:hypothetical protein SDJN02_21469, partial [Cucurbita argyrosperma subsp. argyrosperma]
MFFDFHDRLGKVDGRKKNSPHQGKDCLCKSNLEISFA